MLKNSSMKNDKFVYLTKMLFYTIKKKQQKTPFQFFIFKSKWINNLIFTRFRNDQILYDF